MRQRVGFARALVVEPDALLMDEPFSALDVLTAENLRGELVELWDGHELPDSSRCCIVTHNIEEAVLLADRVLVLSLQPRPHQGRARRRTAPPARPARPAFEALVDTIYGILTGREQAAVDALARAPPRPRRTRPCSPSHAARVRRRRWPACSKSSPPAAAATASRRSPTTSTSRSTTCCPLSRRGRHAHARHVIDGPTSRSPPPARSSPPPTSSPASSSSPGTPQAAPLVRTIIQGPRRHRRRHPARRVLPRHPPSRLLARRGRSQLDTAIDWGRYAELYDYDADTDQITADPAAGVVAPATV